MDAPRAPRVARPVMLHRWAAMTFLHWSYDPAAVQRRLPRGLQVETIGGRAWVGLLPFRMERVRPPGLPPAPWLSHFPETNVRTYVRGPDGQSAIWFFSLDASRLPAVAGGRAGYGLPYFWSRMDVEPDGARVRYRGRRRWPGPSGAGYRVTVEPGAPFGPDEPGRLDHFLTARYVLYTSLAGRLAQAHAEHRPWPLHRAEVVEVDQDLVQAAGLPPPEGEPLAHWSPGVDVRIGMWKPVRTGRGRR
jgi:uncharacterized protein YqjF (DUF2071 family)